jgi:phosphatidylglycerophosphatase A
MKALVSFFSTTYITFCSVGFVSSGQGTLASLISLPFILSLRSFLPTDSTERMYWIAGIVFVLSIVAVLAIPRSKHVPKSDCDQPLIVIDEVIGMLVTLSPLLLIESYTWTHSLAALALFRVFDVWKPLGIKQIDNWNSPFGVVLDDIVAGAYSAGILAAFLLL